MFINCKKEVLAMAIANSILFGSVDAFLSGRKRSDDHIIVHGDNYGVADKKDAARQDTAAAAAQSKDHSAAHHHDAYSATRDHAAPSHETMNGNKSNNKADSNGSDAGALTKSGSIDMHASPPMLRKGAFEQKKTVRRAKAAKSPSDTKAPKATKSPSDTKAPKSTKSPSDTKSPKSSKGQQCFTGSFLEVIAACDAAGADCCCSNDSCPNYADYGGRACYWTGADQTVCAGACNGDFACSNYNGDQTETFIFEEGSCNGYSACYQFYGSFGKDSCNGPYACNYRYGDVDDDSCNGPNACQFGDGAVSKKSCNDDSACYKTYVDVEEEACNNDYACAYRDSAKVDKKTCNNANECREPAP